MSRRRARVATRCWVAVSTSVLAALLFVACGGGSSHSAAPPATSPASSNTAAAPTTAPPLRDTAPTGADFVNINTMTRVDDHFVGSLNGHLAAALAVAHSAGGGVYPVGTVIQLIPTEAMVKRYKGYSPATHDWEMFSLSVSATGTRILAAGTKNVVNRFGSNCASCHASAAPAFDFVCGKTHGCAPLPVTDAIIAALQRGDPRPRSAS